MDKDKKIGLKIIHAFQEEVPEEIYDDALRRFEEITKEHSADHESKKYHTFRRIYPIAVTYLALLDHQKEREIAFQLVKNVYYEKFIYRAANNLRRVLKFPGLLNIIPRLMGRSSPYNEEAGFHMEIPKEPDNREIYFEVWKCPYYEECKKLNVPELTDIFCTTDDICYGNAHPRVIFQRKNTIGRGGEFCDFHFIFKKSRE